MMDVDECTKKLSDLLAVTTHEEGKVASEETLELLRSCFIHLCQVRQQATGKWHMNMLLDEKTGLFNCGCCFKCWEAPRDTDIYKAGFHYCPNCGAKMEESK